MAENKNKENCKIIHQDITVSTSDFKIVPNICVRNEYSVFNYNHNFYMNICDFYDLCGEKYHFANIKGKAISFPDIVVCTDATRRNVYVSLHGCEILCSYSDKYKPFYILFDEAIKSINVKEDKTMTSIICNIINSELNNTVKEDALKKMASKIIAAYNSITDTTQTDELIKKIDELYNIAHKNNNNIIIKEEDNLDNTEQKVLVNDNVHDTYSEIASFSMFDNDTESSQVIQTQVVSQNVTCTPVINTTDQYLKRLSDTIIKKYCGIANVSCEDLRIKIYKLFGYFLGKGDLVAQRKLYEKEHGKIQIIDYYCVMNYISDYLLMLLGETRNNRNIYTDDYNGKTVTNEIYKECIKLAIEEVFGLEGTNENIEKVIEQIRLKSSYYPQV